MQISTTTLAIRESLKRIFTPNGSPGFTRTYDEVSSLDQNNFALTITNSYPYQTNDRARFVLMKGAVPTDFTALTLPSSRSTDVLVSWTVKTTSGTWVENSNNSLYLTSTDLAYATQSGTATWLWWYNPKHDNTQILHQAVFTVGTLGSASDFELANTSIVSGKGYKLVNGPTVSLPTEYNY